MRQSDSTGFLWNVCLPVLAAQLGTPCTQASNTLHGSSTGWHFLEAAKDKQFPLLAWCSWLPEVTCCKRQKGQAHLFLNNCEQECKTHYRQVKFMMSAHRAHPPGLAAQPPCSTRMALTFSADPELAVERNEQLYQQFAILWQVPARFCLAHTCSLLLAGCSVWQWSCPSLTGSRDLEGQEMAKKPLNVHIPTLHALNFPSCWLQQKLAGWDVIHAQPTSTAHAPLKQTWNTAGPKLPLAELSVGCLSAKNTCVAEHGFRCPKLLH